MFLFFFKDQKQYSDSEFDIKVLYHLTQYDV